MSLTFCPKWRQTHTECTKYIAYTIIKQFYFTYIQNVILNHAIHNHTWNHFFKTLNSSKVLSGCISVQFFSRLVTTHFQPLSFKLSLRNQFFFTIIKDISGFFLLMCSENQISRLGEFSLKMLIMKSKWMMWKVFAWLATELYNTINKQDVRKDVTFSKVGFVPLVLACSYIKDLKY